MCMPAPGCNTLPTTRPTSSAMVEHHLEIDESLQPDHADAAHVAHLGDADRDGDEDDDRHDGADEPDEGVAQRLQATPRWGLTSPSEDAERDADQHLDIELLQPAPSFPSRFQACRIFTTTLIASSTRSRA